MSEIKKHQIFIASCCKDYEWVCLCLRSLRKFALGFEPPIVCVPEGDVAWMRAGLIEAHSQVIIRTRHARKSSSTRAPFMDAQLAMMSADLYSDADYIWILGSDSFVTAPLHVEDFMCNNLPIFFYASYETLKACHPDCFVWKRGTERALGVTCQNEFMRRLPVVFHRSTFLGLRSAVAGAHAGFVPTFSEYVYRMDEIYSDTSETNWLGEWAWNEERSKYVWEDVGCGTLQGKPYKDFVNPVVTFWSHGGLDKPVDLEFEIDGKSIKGRTPRAVMKEVLFKS